MATPVFCCGFECGVSGVHWTLDAPASFSTGTVRSGARALRINAAGAVSQVLGTTLASSNIFVARFYIRFATLPNVNCVLFGVTATNEYGLVFKQSDSKLYPGRGVTTTVSFGATGATVTTGVWYRIDLRVDISNNPRLVDVSVDGVALTQFSVGVASGTYTVPFASVSNNAAPTADVFFDDVIMSQTTGDFPFGAGFVNHFVPTSDGTHNVAGAGDFTHGTAGSDITNATTDAWTLVDDVPLPSSITTTDLINILAPPNATDYVECIFGPASGISTPTVGPRMVEVLAAIHQAGTGNGNMEIRLNDNGTMGTIYTATGVAGVTSLAYKRAAFADPPSAATVWNALNDGSNGDFLDLRFRFGSPGAVDANPDQYLDAIMIEAEFPAGTVVDTAVGTVTIAGLAPTVSVTSNLNITTAVGTVTIAGLAPTVSVSDHKNITAGLGTVVIAGLAPTVSVSDNKNITAGLGVVTIEGLAPTVSVSNNTNITTDTGVVTIAGLAPTVSVTDNKNIITAVGTVVIAGLEPTVQTPVNILTDKGEVVIDGLAPTVQTPRNILPGIGIVTIEGLAPTVSVSDNKNIEAGLGTVVIEGLAPTIQTPVNIQTGLGVVSIDGLAPTVSVTQNAFVFPGVGQVVIQGLEPSIGSNIVVSTATGLVTIVGFAPTVSVTNHINVQTDTGVVVITGLAPTVTASDHKNVFPGIGSVVINGLAPTVQTPVNILTGIGEIVITGLEPTITTVGGPAMVVTQTGQLVITGLSPHVHGGRKRFLVRKSKVANDANKFSTIDRANLKSKINDI